MREIERLLVAQRRAITNGLNEPRLYAYAETDPEAASQATPKSVISARPLNSITSVNVEFTADETLYGEQPDEMEQIIHAALHGKTWGGPEGFLNFAYHLATDHERDAGGRIVAILKWWGLATWRPTHVEIAGGPA